MPHGDRGRRTIVASKRPVGRPSKTVEYQDWVAASLRRRPDLRALDLLERARRSGYSGGKSAFYDLVARVRAGGRPPVARHRELRREFEARLKILRDCIDAIAEAARRAR
jgi:hypothetical protein